MLASGGGGTKASAHCIQDAKLQVRHDNVRVCILQHAYGVSEHNQYGAALLNIHGAKFADNTCIVFCSSIAWVLKMLWYASTRARSFRRLGSQQHAHQALEIALAAHDHVTHRAGVPTHAREVRQRGLRAEVGGEVGALRAAKPSSNM